MAFSYTNNKGKKYYLHCKKVTRSSGKDTILYFFSLDIKPGQALDAVPAGKKVIEMKNGLPVLKNA